MAINKTYNFYSRASCEARRSPSFMASHVFQISTHAPRVRRDNTPFFAFPVCGSFLLTRLV